jgi:hypothetical protein
MAAIEYDAIYTHSDNVVSRVIEGEVIIVPLVSGIGDADDDLFSLNETGQDIWQRLDGQTSVAAILDVLAGEYDAPRDTIAAETSALLSELLARGMIQKAAP